MSVYKITNKVGIKHFITLTTLNWLDIFTKPAYFDILVDGLKHCQKNKGLVIYGYVIMINHLHLLLASRYKKYALSNIICDYKKYTARRIFSELDNDNRFYIKNHLINYRDKKRNMSFQLWQSDNHPIVIESEKFFNQKLDYIHNNPVKKRYVEAPEDWIYSSTRNYILDDYSIINV